VEWQRGVSAAPAVFSLTDFDGSFCGIFWFRCNGLVGYGEVLTELAKSQLPWRITRLREQQALTQAALAEKAGLAPSTISQLERGNFEGIQFKTIVKLAAFFEASLDYMSGMDHAQVVRAAAFLGRPCTECGVLEAHSVPQCALEMFEKGRSYVFIAARFQMTLATVEVMIRDEIRIRRERPVRASKS
jgi:transcriptional regulator with XRE-family HTH domain